jgi:membrane-bound metal-dependent hydrolase YbcI (DUF457 family)
MDPLTHVVVARSLEYVRRREPADRGQTLAVVLGALAPDVDALLMPTGWDRYLAAHEIGTHALAGAAACAVLAAGLTRVLRRGSRYRALLPAALVGAASHIVADLLSGATIRVGWPFVETRVMNVGAFAMGDPFVVAAGAATLVAWVSRSRWRPGVAATLLLVLALGITGKAWSRVRALQAYRTSPAARAADGPVLIQPVAASWSDWQVIDRTTESVRAWRVSGGSTPDVRLAFTIPRLPNGDAVSATALAASYRWETVRNLLRAHDFTFATIATDQVSGETHVLWSDIRYCTTPVACGIRAGGVLSPAGELRLLVHVGDWVQAR